MQEARKPQPGLREADRAPTSGSLISSPLHCHRVTCLRLSITVESDRAVRRSDAARSGLRHKANAPPSRPYPPTPRSLLSGFLLSVYRGVRASIPGRARTHSHLSTARTLASGWGVLDTEPGARILAADDLSLDDGQAPSTTD